MRRRQANARSRTPGRAGHKGHGKTGVHPGRVEEEEPTLCGSVEIQDRGRDLVFLEAS